MHKVPTTTEASLTENSLNPKNAINGIAVYTPEGPLKSLKALKNRGYFSPLWSVPFMSNVYASTPITASSAKNPGGISESLYKRIPKPNNTMIARSTNANFLLRDSLFSDVIFLQLKSMKGLQAAGLPSQSCL